LRETPGTGEDDATMSEANDHGATSEPDWLERALRDAGGEHRAAYIADDGFSARVAAALPAPARLPAWRKPVVAALWAVAATGIAIALPDAVGDVARQVIQLLATRPVSLESIATGLAALGVAAWSAAVYVLRRSDWD
jgi:hypothetical protein